MGSFIRKNSCLETKRKLTHTKKKGRHDDDDDVKRRLAEDTFELSTQP
jgi:hypothetical protein